MNTISSSASRQSSSARSTDRRRRVGAHGTPRHGRFPRLSWHASGIRRAAEGRDGDFVTVRSRHPPTFPATSGKARQGRQLRRVGVEAGAPRGAGGAGRRGGGAGRASPFVSYEPSLPWAVATRPAIPTTAARSAPRRAIPAWAPEPLGAGAQRCARPSRRHGEATGRVLVRGRPPRPPSPAPSPEAGRPAPPPPPPEPRAGAPGRRPSPLLRFNAGAPAANAPPPASAPCPRQSPRRSPRPPRSGTCR